MSYGTATDARIASVRALRARVVGPLSVAMLAVAAVGAAPASAQPDPPPGRAYELVSPVDDPSGAAAGISNEFLPLPARASEDGDRLVYGAGTVVGSSWSGAVNPLIFGHRTATGWKARVATRSVDQGDTPLELSAAEPAAGWVTDDASEVVFASSRSYGVVPPAIAGAQEVFGTILRSTDAPAPPSWLSAPNAGIAPQKPGSDLSPAAADDTSVVAFPSYTPLTADAPPAGTSAVYVRRNGVTELVSRLPDGTVPATDSYLANSSRIVHGASNAPAVAMRNQLAGEGRFVLFSVVPAGGGSGVLLFVRDLERNVTHQLAGGGSGAAELNFDWGGAGLEPDADTATVPRGVVFAASAGSRAFFKPTRPDNAVPAFLYEADLETGVVTARSAITGPPLGLSADGRRMLFLEPPASGTFAGDWTLRYWDAANPGTSVAVGTVTAATDPAPSGLARVFRVSADGNTWVFTAVGSADPDHPSAGGPAQQLYRWTVGESHPTCLTCSSVDGVARTSGVNLTVQESVREESFLTPTVTWPVANIGRIKLAQPGHSISDDGRWLLFDSPDRLVAADTDDVRDVYLWDRDGAPGGQLQLVSGRPGVSPSYALDLDPTGRNAFFSTRESLVAEDVDGAYDVYTARIGGGFKLSSPACAAESCRPSPGVPAAPVAGSIAFAGQGNLPLSADVVKAAVRVSELKAVTGTVAKLKVRVSGAGSVAVSGSSVRKAARSARGAGTYTMRVALSNRAKASLKKRGKLKVTVRVSYQPKSGRSVARSLAITFKQSKRVANAKGGR